MCGGSDHPVFSLCCIRHVLQVTCSHLDSGLHVVYECARQSARQSKRNKEMSIPAGSDDKGHEVRLIVDGGQKLDFAESQSQYTSSIDLAKVFVEDHDHNQDGISVLLNKDAGVFWFHSNLGRCFMKSDISGEVVFDFKPGVWYSYTMQELADLGHHFTIE